MERRRQGVAGIASPEHGRHVRTTVAMELAALHHSAQRPKSKVVEGPSEGEVRETYGAPRRLKALLPGKRSGVLLDPEPQVAAVTVGYVAAGAPLLVVASLAGGDELDATTVSYLLRENLKRTKKEEEEKERRVLEVKAKAKAAEKEEAQMLKLSERIRHDMPLTESEWAVVPLASLLFWQEEEKEEEEETSSRWPRSSSTTEVACPWLLIWCSSRCIPFVCRQDSAARHYGRNGPERQCSSCASRRFRHMQGWFCWYCTSRCVHSCRRRQATDACHHGRYGSEGAVRGAVQNTADFRSCS